MNQTFNCLSITSTADGKSTAILRQILPAGTSENVKRSTITWTDSTIGFGMVTGSNYNISVVVQQTS